MYELHKYLSKVLPEALPLQSRLTTVHAHVRLTTSALVKDSFPFDIFGLWTNGIRIQAEKLGVVMDRWFRYSWWKLTNGVISDFVLSNNLIEESIRVNLRRFLCKDATFSEGGNWTGLTTSTSSKEWPDSDKVESFQAYQEQNFKIHKMPTKEPPAKSTQFVVPELSSEEIGGKREKEGLNPQEIKEE